MKQLKIGLVLPGGGARGAFQLGVLLALEKFRLTSGIGAIAGGSIGAFSLLLYQMHDYRRAYSVCRDMNSERVLGYKKNVKSKLPVKGQGLFSRDPLNMYLNSHFDLGEFVDTDLPLYTSLAKVEKRGLKSSYSPKYFKLNHLDHYSVKQLLLATSAIPLVFDAIKIEGSSYVDCLKADNEPFAPLLSDDINCLFVIPLTSSHNPRNYYNLPYPVVDFESPELRNSPMINMLGFEPKKVDLYLNCGYFTGVSILRILSDSGILTSLELPRYSNTQTLGIEIRPNRLLAIDEIIDDAKKGPRK